MGENNLIEVQMEKKVLVVDDSQTIQKVVSITLASMPYSLVPCLNEEELFNSLDESTSLILLDYTLSEGKTGLDIAKEIHQKVTGIPILMMLGTFDSISDSDLEAAGVQDKIVKPFESEKFIRKCQGLIESLDESAGVTSFLNKEEIVGEEPDVSSEDDSSSIEGWIVDSPKPQDSSNVTEEIEINEIAVMEPVEDQLEQEAQAWAGSVPEPIEEDVLASAIMPPVISEEEKSTEAKADSEIFNDEETLPSDDDLDYPDVGSSIEDLQNVQLSSSLVSLDELAVEEVDREEVTNTDVYLSPDLLQEVNAEVSADDFWAVDSDEGEGPSFSREEEDPKLEDVVVEASSPSIDLSSGMGNDEIINQLKVAMEPMLENFVKEFCAQKIEQVAWEVIPDLAENLIKKELNKIAESVKD